LTCSRQEAGLSPSFNPTKYHGEGPPRTSGPWRISIECATFSLFFCKRCLLGIARVGRWHTPLLPTHPTLDLPAQHHRLQDPTASTNDKDHRPDSIRDMPAVTSHIHRPHEGRTHHHDIRALVITLPELDTHRLQAKPNM
jgi:hypothetical protein